MKTHHELCTQDCLHMLLAEALMEQAVKDGCILCSIRSEGDVGKAIRHARLSIMDACWIATEVT